MRASWREYSSCGPWADTVSASSESTCPAAALVGPISGLRISVGLPTQRPQHVEPLRIRVRNAQIVMHRSQPVKIVFGERALPLLRGGIAVEHAATDRSAGPCPASAVHMKRARISRRKLHRNHVRRRPVRRFQRRHEQTVPILAETATDSAISANRLICLDGRVKVSVKVSHRRADIVARGSRKDRLHVFVAQGTSDHSFAVRARSMDAGSRMSPQFIPGQFSAASRQLVGVFRFTLQNGHVRHCNGRTG